MRAWHSLSTAAMCGFHAIELLFALVAAAIVFAVEERLPR